MKDLTILLLVAWYVPQNTISLSQDVESQRKMQDYNSCRCGCIISYDWGVIVAERHPFCPKNFSIWEIKSSHDDESNPKHTIRLKIVPLMHRRKSDLLLIFDGLSRGNPILYDSRVPNKFPFNSEFVSSGNSARIEYRTNHSAISNDSFFRGTIIYFEFLDQNGASLRYRETRSESSLKAKSPFLVIFIFISVVSFAGIFLWVCFIRRKHPNPGSGGNVNEMGKEEEEEGPHLMCYNPAFIPASGSNPAIIVESPSRRYAKCPSRLSGPDLDHSEKALISQSSFTKETRNVGIQLSSPALFLKHFHPSQDALNSVRSRNAVPLPGNELPLTSRSSGRGESPLSLDNLDFEYDEEDFLGGGPRLDPLQTVVIN